MLLQSVLPEGLSFAVVGVPLLLIGAGTALVLPPLVAAVLSAAPKPLAGSATGTLNSIRQLGASFGVALVGIAVHAGHDFMEAFRISMISFGMLAAAGGLLVAAFMDRRRL